MDEDDLRPSRRRRMEEAQAGDLDDENDADVRPIEPLLHVCCRVKHWVLIMTGCWLLKSSKWHETCVELNLSRFATPLIAEWQHVV